jgi:hypothetical protein
MKGIEEYMRLPYRIVLTHDEDEDGYGDLWLKCRSCRDVTARGDTERRRRRNPGCHGGLAVGCS